jgi:hypothetical protein
MGPAQSFDPEVVEQALGRLPCISMEGLFRRSSNYTFLVRLQDVDAADGEGLLAVYKPARGESPLWDFPAGTLYRREVAAYRLARFLGWPRVPPTVVREEGPHGVGALQLYLETDPSQHFLSADERPSDTWLPIALFDVVANNADRKSGHCLIDEEERVWVIDHGLTFHAHPKLRTVIWDFAGQRPTEALRDDLARAEASLRGGPLADGLDELLSRRELQALRRRVAAVLAPGYELPHPGSAWSVPWPPV